MSVANNLTAELLKMNMTNATRTVFGCAFFSVTVKRLIVYNKNILYLVVVFNDYGNYNGARQVDYW